MAINTYKVGLHKCNICDQGCKYLVDGLHKCFNTYGAMTILFTMDLGWNTIANWGVNYPSTLLNVGCIEDLRLDSNELISLQGIDNIISISSLDYSVLIAAAGACYKSA